MDIDIYDIDFMNCKILDSKVVINKDRVRFEMENQSKLLELSNLYAK